MLLLTAIAAPQNPIITGGVDREDDDATDVSIS